jgi:hypothetical protein
MRGVVGGSPEEVVGTCPGSLTDAVDERGRK